MLYCVRYSLHQTYNRRKKAWQKVLCLLKTLLSGIFYESICCLLFPVLMLCGIVYSVHIFCPFFRFLISSITMSRNLWSALHSHFLYLSLTWFTFLIQPFTSPPSPLSLPLPSSRPPLHNPFLSSSLGSCFCEDVVPILPPPARPQSMGLKCDHEITTRQPN